MEEKKQLKEISQSGKKENVSLKEKYDILVNKLYYASLVLTAIGIFYLGKGIGEFRERVISLNPEYEFSKFSDFKICIVLITLISIFKYCIQRALIKFCQKIMKNSFKHPKNENDKILAKKYKYKLPMHVYKCGMYTALTIFGYYVLKDLNFFPKSLLGHGWLPNMFINGYPKSFYFSKPPLFDFYYQFCLSYFSSDLIWLLFINERQTDFVDMLLHHSCTISLIVFSHLTHYSNVGSIVLYLHIQSDIFVHFTRILLQTDLPEIIKDISGLILLVNFLYMRIYVLGEIIYVLYHYVTWKGTVDWFLLILLVIIYFMHINWSIMLLHKMVQMFTGKKLTDNSGYKINKEKKNKEKI